MVAKTRAAAQTRIVSVGDDGRGGGVALYQNIDHLASNIILPLGGMLIAIFAGWVMCKNSTADELDIGTGALYKTWRYLTRWVAPLAVLVVFLHAAGILTALGLV